MHKVWAIATREYLATVKTKAFVFTVLFIPFMAALSVAAQNWAKNVADRDPRRIAVIDRTPKQAAYKALSVSNELRRAKFEAAQALPDAAAKEDDAPRPFTLELIEPSADGQAARDEQRLALSDRVRKGELSGFLEAGPDSMKPIDLARVIASAFAGAAKKNDTPAPGGRNEGPEVVRFQCKPTAPGATSFWQFAVQELMQARMLGDKARDPAAVKALKDQKNPFPMLGLSERGPDGAVLDDEGAAKGLAKFFAAYGALAMMFVVTMIAAQPLLQSVLEEKASKISELLLGSASPMQLMYGKLLGGVGIGLTLAALMVGGGLFLLHRMGYGGQVPLALVPWFVLYAALSVVMFGALFTAVGSACSDLKEAQALMTPVSLCLTAPMLLVLLVLINPNSLETRIATLIPFATPSLMVTRIALGGDIPWWEHALAVAGVFAATALCVWAAGRIFRIGFLMSGKAPKFGELLRWVAKA